MNLAETHAEIVMAGGDVREATARHNTFLGQPGAPLVPGDLS